MFHLFSGFAKSGKARLAILSLLLMSLSSTAVAQNELYWDRGTSYNPRNYVSDGARVPERLLKNSTRNRVIIFMDKAGAVNQFSGAKFLSVQFVGLNGTLKVPASSFDAGFPQYPKAPGFKLMEYYQGLIITDSAGQTSLAIPPSSTILPFSGSTMPDGEVLDFQAITVHNIPIPPELGPIVEVIVDTKGKRKWPIDKMIVDGRTFSFEKSDAALASRMSTHFVLGSYNGNANDRGPNPRPQRIAIGSSSGINTYSQTGGILMPNPAMNNASIRKLYSCCELYKEPVLDSQTKTITVRVKFDDIVLRQESDYSVPKITVSLEDADGTKTIEKITNGAAIFNNRFISFRMPGNFVPHKVNVSLPNRVAKAKISEVGLIVEEGILPELVFQDNASLDRGKGKISKSLDRFGSLAATFTLKDMALGEAREKLRQRATRTTILALSENAAEQSALEVVLDKTRVLTHYKFDKWFETVNAGTLENSVTSHDLLPEMDALFLNDDAKSHAWRSTVRARLSRLIDERALALAYIDRMSNMFALHQRVVDSELDKAELFLNLSADATVDITIPGKPASGFGLSSLSSTLTLFQIVPGPVAKAASSFSTLLNYVRAVDNLSGTNQDSSSTSTTGQTNTASNQNKLRAVIGNIRTDVSQNNVRSAVAIQDLRTLTIKDQQLMAELAGYHITLNNHPAQVRKGEDIGEIAKEISDVKARVGRSLEFHQYKQFAESAHRSVRRDLLRVMLPVRGILYGKFKEKLAFGRFSYDAFNKLESNDFEPQPNDLSKGALATSYVRYSTVSPKPNFALSAFVDTNVDVHEWYYAVGIPPAAVPSIASEVVHNGRGSWEYITSAMTPREVWNLMVFGGAKFAIEMGDLDCDLEEIANSTGWACNVDASKRTPKIIPGWRSPDFQTKLKQVTASGEHYCYDDGKFSKSSVCGNTPAPPSSFIKKDGSYKYDFYLWKKTPVPVDWVIYLKP